MSSIDEEEVEVEVAVAEVTSRLLLLFESFAFDTMEAVLVTVEVSATEGNKEEDIDFKTEGEKKGEFEV